MVFPLSRMGGLLVSFGKQHPCWDEIFENWPELVEVSREHDGHSKGLWKLRYGSFQLSHQIHRQLSLVHRQLNETPAFLSHYGILT
jgi:hypothetical protein